MLIKIVNFNEYSHCRLHCFSRYMLVYVDDVIIDYFTIHTLIRSAKYYEFIINANFVVFLTLNENLSKIIYQIVIGKMEENVCFWT